MVIWNLWDCLLSQPPTGNYLLPSTCRVQWGGHACTLTPSQATKVWSGSKHKIPTGSISSSQESHFGRQNLLFKNDQGTDTHLKLSAELFSIVRQQVCAQTHSKSQDRDEGGSMLTCGLERRCQPPLLRLPTTS